MQIRSMTITELIRASIEQQCCAALIGMACGNFCGFLMSQNLTWFLLFAIPGAIGFGFMPKANRIAKARIAAFYDAQRQALKG